MLWAVRKLSSAVQHTLPSVSLALSNKPHQSTARQLPTDSETQPTAIDYPSTQQQEQESHHQVTSQAPSESTSPSISPTSQKHKPSPTSLSGLHNTHSHRRLADLLHVVRQSEYYKSTLPYSGQHNMTTHSLGVNGTGATRAPSPKLTNGPIYSQPQDTQSLSADDFLETSTYAARARNLVKLVNAMRDAGAHMDLDLPTIVVCGNQSVGKSSVIEALCGVVLPRNEGTCTRSVTEVRLSEHDTEHAGALNDSSWSCTVKLRYEYDSAGRPLKAVKEVIFGREITEKEHVEIMVRRAQKALLNPSADPARYLDYTFDDSTAAARDKEAASNELKFIKNVVCLDIRGAGVNLTLIDLPGIIRSVDKREDTQYIDLVQDLVRFYISKERAIIVATITCKDEIDNQVRGERSHLQIMFALTLRAI